MFEVQFYSIYLKKNVTISKHKKLFSAIKKARWAYSDGGYINVSILQDGLHRLDRYGTIDLTLL